MLILSIDLAFNLFTCKRAAITYNYVSMALELCKIGLNRPLYLFQIQTSFLRAYKIELPTFKISSNCVQITSAKV
jgi:hypothetical protein